MTVIKLEATLPKSGGHAANADQLWANLGSSYFIIAEVRVSERTEPEDVEDKEPSAKLKVVQLEIATEDDQEVALSDRLQRMYRRRTNKGTLDEHVDPATGEIRGALSLETAQRLTDALRGGPDTISHGGKSATIGRDGAE